MPAREVNPGGQQRSNRISKESSKHDLLVLSGDISPGRDAAMTREKAAGQITDGQWMYGEDPRAEPPQPADVAQGRSCPQGWGQAEHCWPRSLALHEEVEVGPGELLVDAVEQLVRVLRDVRGDRLSRQEALLRGVGEGERAGVDEAVIPDQQERDSDGVSQPPPVTAEGGDVGDNAHQGFGAPGSSA